jgi:hypothetical protein
MWVVLDLKADFNSANLLLLDMQAKKKTGGTQASRAFTTKVHTCSSRRQGAGATGLRRRARGPAAEEWGCSSIEEPGV